MNFENIHIVDVKHIIAYLLWSKAETEPILISIVKMCTYVYVLWFIEAQKKEKTSTFRFAFFFHEFNIRRIALRSSCQHKSVVIADIIT